MAPPLISLETQIGHLHNFSSAEYPEELGTFLQESVEDRFQTNYGFFCNLFNQLFNGDINDVVGDKMGIFFTNTAPGANRFLDDIINARQDFRKHLFRGNRVRRSYVFFEFIADTRLEEVLKDLGIYADFIDSPIRQTYLKHTLDIYRDIFQLRKSMEDPFQRSPSMQQLYESIIGLEPNLLETDWIVDRLYTLLSEEGYYRNNATLLDMITEWNATSTLSADEMIAAWPEISEQFRADMRKYILPFLGDGAEAALDSRVLLNKVDEEKHPKFHYDAMIIPKHKLDLYYKAIEYLTYINLRNELQKKPEEFELLIYHEMMHVFSMAEINRQVISGTHGFEHTLLSPFSNFAPFEEARAVMAKMIIHGDNYLDHMNNTEQIAFFSRLLSYYGKHNVLFDVMDRDGKMSSEEIQDVFMSQYAISASEAFHKSQLYHQKYLAKLRAVNLASYAPALQILQDSFKDPGREAMIPVLFGQYGPVSIPTYSVMRDLVNST